jgi:hypothetical protein
MVGSGRGPDVNVGWGSNVGSGRGRTEAAARAGVGLGDVHRSEALLKLARNWQCPRDLCWNGVNDATPMTGAGDDDVAHHPLVGGYWHVYVDTGTGTCVCVDMRVRLGVEENSKNAVI